MDASNHARVRQRLWGEGETLLLARLIYGEARGEPRAVKVAVGAVPCNRARRPDWWGRSLRDVCLKRWQFSCFNADDVNLPVLLGAGLDDPAFVECLGVAFAVQHGYAADPTAGATHYHDRTIRPAWAARMEKTLETTRFVFYRDRPRLPLDPV